MPPASNARATSVAAPSPTIRPMRSSGSRPAPHSTSSALAASAMSRRESISVPSRSNTIKRKRSLKTSERRARKARREEVALRASRALRSRWWPVFSKRSGRLPDRHAYDGQTLLFGLVIDQLRDALDRRVAVEQIHRLSELLQQDDERIVVPQQHLVIELLVDPALDDALDVAEIAHHVTVVQRAGA